MTRVEVVEEVQVVEVADSSISVEIIDSDNGVEVASTDIVVEVHSNIQVVEISAPGPQGPSGPPGAAGTTDHLSASFTAGEDLSGHRLVKRQPDGTLIYASNDTITDINGPIWMTTASALAGEDTVILLVGGFVEPSWDWTSGAPIYLGSGGLMTQAVPAFPSAFSVQVGYAISATEIYLDQYSAIRLI